MSYASVGDVTSDFLINFFLYQMVIIIKIIWIHHMNYTFCSCPQIIAQEVMPNFRIKDVFFNFDYDGLR